MYTLDTFYKSDAWEKLIRMLRLERVDGNGNIICAHCGEPIVRAYDCIGHHVIHLTEDNVNDAMISLNPDNIELVHHRCHNRIHEKLQFGASMRHVYLVYGAPLSGKTTWVNDSKSVGDLVIDLDSIWQCVSGCDRYVKPARLKANVFGIRDKLLEDVKYRRGKWSNAYVIGGYPLIGERERICRDIGAEEIFIECPIEECLHRLEIVDDGRNKEEWEKYISDWFRKYAPRSH